MNAMIDSVVIHGIKYKAVDIPSEFCDETCKDCDIYKAKIPQHAFMLPLCCEDEYKRVNKSCCSQFKKGINRKWKKEL